MEVFSDREHGGLPRIELELGSSARDGILAEIQRAGSNGLLTEHFGEDCYDKKGRYGFDESQFARYLEARMPGLQWPSNSSGLTSEQVFDLVEVVANCISKPVRGIDHSYFSHVDFHHFDRASGLSDFVEQVDFVLARNGIGFKLKADGHLSRVDNPLGSAQVSRMRIESGDAVLDDFMVRAVERFRSAKAHDLDDGLSLIWKAFERTKTLRSGNRKQGIGILLDEVSKGQMREVLEAEANALTLLGNANLIRHSEVNQAAVDDEEKEYLFNRMAAFLYHIYRRADILG